MKIGLAIFPEICYFVFNFGARLKHPYLSQLECIIRVEPVRSDTN
jgi:hypothetical protein